MRLVAAVLTLLISLISSGYCPGEYPAFERSFEVFGDREVTGNTLMVYNQNVNKALIDGGSVGTLVDVPPGATVEAAYLFWTGTTIKRQTIASISRSPTERCSMI